MTQCVIKLADISLVYIEILVDGRKETATGVDDPATGLPVLGLKNREKLNIYSPSGPNSFLVVLVGSIFMNKLVVFEKDECRTPQYNEVIEQICGLSAVFSDSKKEQASETGSLSNMVIPVG